VVEADQVITIDISMDVVAVTEVLRNNYCWLWLAIVEPLARSK